MKFIATKNRGYQWYEKGNIHFRGYIQYRNNGTVLRGEDAIGFFRGIIGVEALKERLAEITGLFSIVKECEDGTVLAAVDHLRSMPIYYSTDYRYISDDSEAIRLAGGYEKISPDRLLEMYATFIVAYDKTIYEEIKQIPCGSIIRFSPAGEEKVSYFPSFIPSIKFDENGAIEELDKRTKIMVERLCTLAGERELVLSLSGGYDSRYLAMAFKKYGNKNLTCFSYGIKGSFEIKTAHEIATTLGFKHIVIDTTEKIKRAIEDRDTFDYCMQHDYTIYLQNYVAARELKEKGLITEDAIIFTGLFNDAPAGFYVPPDDELNHYKVNNEGVSIFVMDRRFWLTSIRPEEREKLRNDVLNQLTYRKISVTDEDSFVHAANAIMIENEHQRNYFRMNHTHEVFGYEYAAPCTDKDLLEFWYSVPRDMLYTRRLFEKYVTECLGAGFGVTMKRHANELSRSRRLAQFKRIIGGMLVRVLYGMGIPFKRSTDINGIAPLEAAVYKKIKQKDAVIAQHANLGHLMTIYLMEQRYGDNFWSRIKGYIR